MIKTGHGFNDGDDLMFIDVHDQDIRADENTNPVITLRLRLDAWMAGRSGR